MKREVLIEFLLSGKIQEENSIKREIVYTKS
jgi:hypothetical protein